LVAGMGKEAQTLLGWRSSLRMQEERLGRLWVRFRYCCRQDKATQKSTLQGWQLSLMELSDLSVR
jgi:hypothetical protein